ncbi:MAG: pentapeptide repeat-containing protein, partial [Deltaproteobacteria bacterium]|nr:pentapeptide repeat-containing protein [Deltaproteobacteria bacterium]
RKANLNAADMSGANLAEANLTGARLSRANLSGTNLSDADLSSTDFRKTDLRAADLSRANLSGANFSGVDLEDVFLDEAILAGANLSEAFLYGVDLSEKNLNDVNLSGAILTNAALRGTLLLNANLSSANLHGATLISADLSGADLTGALLYGTARDDWKINGVKCDYIFWDSEMKNRTPQNRPFRLEEFEELYTHSPTFEYYFEHGFTPFDAFVMAKEVQRIRAKHPEFELNLDSFHSRGRPHAVFTVIDKEYAEQALRQITFAYETKIKVLEGQKEELDKFVDKLISKEQMGFHYQGGNVNNIYNVEVGKGNVPIMNGQAQIGSVNYYDYSSNAELISEITKLIEEVVTDLDNKQEALDNLQIVVEELKKEKRDKDKLLRFWERVKGVSVEVAKSTAVQTMTKIIMKVLGL